MLDKIMGDVRRLLEGVLITMIILKLYGLIETPWLWVWFPMWGTVLVACAIAVFMCVRTALRRRGEDDAEPNPSPASGIKREDVPPRGDKA